MTRPRARAGDRMTTRDCLPVMACPSNSCALDHNPDNEDSHGHEDAVLSGDGLGNKARQKSPQPGAELKNGGKPALLGLVCIRVDGVVLAHVCIGPSAPYSKSTSP